MADTDSELREQIEQCFIKNNMCDCGDEHTELSIDEVEYFDIQAVVNDLTATFTAHTEAALIRELSMVEPVASHKLAVTVQDRIEQLTTKQPDTERNTDE